MAVETDAPHGIQLGPDAFLDMLATYEDRLSETRDLLDSGLRAVRETRALVLQARAATLRNAECATGAPTLVATVLPTPEQDDGADPNLLAYLSNDETYRIGRRRVPLTVTEQLVLDVLRTSSPEPVSRERLFDALYADEVKPSPGVIDVFLSNLRNKLSLASDGREFIETVRLRGWVLRPEGCGETWATRTLGEQAEQSLA